MWHYMHGKWLQEWFCPNVPSVFESNSERESQRSSFYRLNKQKQDSQHNAANLIDYIIQNLNFPKMVPNLVPETSPGIIVLLMS